MARARACEEGVRAATEIARVSAVLDSPCVQMWRDVLDFAFAP